MSRWVEWGSRKLFRMVHNHNLIYNQCWEDPRLDRIALELTPNDEVLMLTSAGCNALDYALDNPKKIHCVDMNPMQNALLELKIAGIRELDFETFFRLFGEGQLENFPAIYHKWLKQQLSQEAQEMWEENLDYFSGGRFRPSFYFRGTSGALARGLYYWVDHRNIRETLDQMFEAESIEDQKRLYFSEKIDERFWGGFLRYVSSWDATLSLMGVPRPQKHLIDREYEGGITRFIQDCIESVFTRVPLKDNYFWWLYLKGSYTPKRCPEYLKEGNFNALKAGLVDTIEVNTTSVLDFLSKFEGQISRFVLLDHMDWLTSYHKDILKKEWEQILDRSAPGARILWRSAGFSSNFIDSIKVNHQNEQIRVGDRLKYYRDWAADLHKQDRVHTYGSFYIADVAI